MDLIKVIALVQFTVAASSTTLAQGNFEMGISQYGDYLQNL